MMGLGSIAALIGSLASLSGGIIKKVKQVNESDMQRAEPEQFDLGDALGVVGEASNAFSSMTSRKFGVKRDKF